MTSRDAEFVRGLTDVCDALSDETRLQLVFLLARSDRNVGSLCKELKLSQPNASHHLGLLRMSRIVVARRKGHEVFYSLAENVKSTGNKVKISLSSCSVTVER